MPERTRLIALTTLVGMCVLGPATRGDTVLHVDDDAPAGGNGLSWATSFRFLQDALSVASEPANGVTEIRVAQGIYTPDRSEANPDMPSVCCVGVDACDSQDCVETVCALDPFCCDEFWDYLCGAWAHAYCDVSCPEVLATFQLLDGVAIRGGYAGVGATDPDERDIQSFETILSGDLLDNDPGNESIRVFHDDNSWEVITGHACNATALLDGLTVTGAYEYGLHNLDGSPTISHCTFRDSWGRAIQGVNSTSTITACSIDRFSRGISHLGGAPAIIDCRVSRSTGIFNGSQTRALISGCDLIANRFHGVSSFEAEVIIDRCRFIGNYVDMRAVPTMVLSGLGVENLNCTVVVTNSLFVGQFVIIDGDARRGTVTSPCAVLNDGGHTALTNCTVADNAGFGVFGNDGGIRIINSVVWGNGWQQVTGPVAASYSNVQGGFTGPGNIDAEPFAPGPSGTWTADAVHDDATGLTTFTDATASFELGSLVGDYLSLVAGAAVLGPSRMLIVANDVTTVTARGLYEESLFGGKAGNVYQVVQFHLTAGSPCLDAGMNAAVPRDAEDADDDGVRCERLPLDLDRHARFTADDLFPDPGCGAPVVVDMGAFEFQGDPTGIIWADATGDGVIDELDVVAIFEDWGTGDCLSADINGDLSVNTDDFLAVLSAWGSCP